MPVVRVVKVVLLLRLPLLVVVVLLLLLPLPLQLLLFVLPGKMLVAKSVYVQESSKGVPRQLA